MNAPTATAPATCAGCEQMRGWRLPDHAQEIRTLAYSDAIRYAGPETARAIADHAAAKVEALETEPGGHDRYGTHWGQLAAVRESAVAVAPLEIAAHLEEHGNPDAALRIRRDAVTGPRHCPECGTYHDTANRRRECGDCRPD